MTEKAKDSATSSTIPHPERQPFMTAHAYRLAERGDIPSLRRGRRVLFRTVEIRRFAHLPDYPDGASE